MWMYYKVALETYLGRQVGNQSVSDSLRYDGQANGDSGDQIRDGLVQVVPREPVEYRDVLPN